MNPAILMQAASKAWDLVEGLEAADKVMGKLGDKAKMVGNYISKLGDKWVEIQDMSFKAARTMAMSREQALRYNESLIKSTKELAAQYGISAKELNDFQKSYSEAIGRNVILTREQMAHMSALSKITDEATAAQLVDDFDKLGVGIAGATAKIGLMQERAKALGINATKATKTLKDNIRLASSYSFRNGVNDIEKMALRATSMRMDMNAITNAMDKFMNIEGAISTSANLQMLGGSFAANFSNPMGAMYEAMADPKAFQDRLLKTVKGKGRYDEKTGTVQFDPVTMMTLREAAKQLGMSVEQLTNPAMADVQNEKVMQEFAKNANKGGFKSEDIEAIKNLARTNVDEKTGKHYVTLLNEKGEPEKKFVEDLTKEQLKVAQDSQMTEEGLFNDVQDIKTILERVHGRARETKSMKEDYEGMKGWWNATLANIQDVWMKPLSGLYNGITNWLGKQYFAEGGLVKPIHAEIGTVVPGSSYYGDRVPAMVNSGEMILNQKQQKSMFNLISSLALNGGAMYGMNKLGGKMGYGGLGSTMLLANMLGGGQTDVTTLIEAHFIKKAIKSMNPLKTSISEIGKVSEAATESTTTFGTKLTDVTKKWGAIASDLGKNINKSIKTYFTTGKLGKVTSFVGKAGSGAASIARGVGGTTAKWAKDLGNFIAKPFVSVANDFKKTPLAKDLREFSNTIKTHSFNRRANRFITESDSRFIKNSEIKGKWAKRLLKAKGYGQELSGDIKGLFKSSGGNIAEAASKETSSVAKAAGRGGKLLSGLGKAGKIIGKKLPYIGTALAIGGAVSGMMDASSQYDAKIDEIEKSGMSERDKARAKDRATREKNANMGGSVGSAAGGLGGMAAGAAAGAAIGSVVPIVGTAIGGLIGGALGAWGGEALGNTLGKGVGSLFGGSEEEKYLEEQKEHAKAIAGGNEEIVKVLKSIEGKMPTGTRVGDNFGLKIPELESSVIRSIGSIGKHVAIKATDTMAGVVGSLTGADKQKIELNVSGTIKLEGAGKSVDLDFNKLLNNPEFVRKLTETISSRMRAVSDSGKPKGGNGNYDMSKINK